MFVASTKMLGYDRIDILEGIDINKASACKKSDICHYRHFLDKNFNYEPYHCNGCHDLMQKAMNFNDFAIVSIAGNDYGTHFWYLKDKNGILLNFFHYM